MSDTTLDATTEALLEAKTRCCVGDWAGVSSRQTFPVLAVISVLVHLSHAQPARRVEESS